MRWSASRLLIGLAFVGTWFENDHHVGGSLIPTASSSQPRERRAVLRHGLAGLLLTPASAAVALTPQEAERQYNTYASDYDQLDGGPASAWLGIDALRREMLSYARGSVLEVGVGTGLNGKLYPTGGQISAFTGVDISEAMLREAQAKVGALPQWQHVDVRLMQADMTSQLVDLFGAETFDTVVDSFSMCVLGNNGAERALDQMRRVVRSREKGGQLLLLENSRSSNPLLGLYQDATADWAATAGGKGCVYNQDIGRLIRSNRHLTIVEETESAAGLFRWFRVVRND